MFTSWRMSLFALLSVAGILLLVALPHHERPVPPPPRPLVAHAPPGPPPPPPPNARERGDARALLAELRANEDATAVESEVATLEAELAPRAVTIDPARLRRLRAPSDFDALLTELRAVRTDPRGRYALSLVEAGETRVRIEAR